MNMYGFGRMGIGGIVMGGGGGAGGGGGGGGGGGRSRRPRKLTYILPHPEYNAKHVGGVNAVTLGPGCEGAVDEQLYTAGRDGTVRAWNLSGAGKGAGAGAAPSCALTMEGHAGWVNDLAVLRSSVTPVPLSTARRDTRCSTCRRTLKKSVGASTSPRLTPPAMPASTTW